MISQNEYLIASGYSSPYIAPYCILYIMGEKQGEVILIISISFTIIIYTHKN